MASINVTNILQNAGEKAQKAQGESLHTFLASLTASAAVCGLVATMVIILKTRLPELYRSRLRLGRAPKWPAPPIRPRMIFFPMPDLSVNEILEIENYLLDRYLHTVLRIFVALALVIVPILLPLNAVGGSGDSGGEKGLDRLSFANIGLSNTGWYWAHLALAIFVALFVCLTLQYELRYYDRLRQTVNDNQSEDVFSTSTILLTSSSKKPLSVRTIKRHFDAFSGGVCTVRVNRDQRRFVAKVYRRDELISKLEAAETDLIRKATIAYKTDGFKTRERDIIGQDGLIQMWSKYLRNRDRPSMRLSTFGWSVPFIGPKVDTIYYCREEIARYNLEIEHDQQDLSKFPIVNSAFVQFHHRLSIPLAVLALKAHLPPSWTIKPATTYSDIIWPNVSLGWWELCIRKAIIYSLVFILVLGFIFPVTLIGTLSQVSYLASVVPWLAWLDKIPSWLLATIQGVLPTAILALITAMVPVVLRLLANQQGLHSYEAVENSIQLYYFAFLFVQVFLVVSVSTAATTSIGRISNAAASIPTILAQSLPKASNYFFSYITIYTLGAITFNLMQLTTLICIGVLSPLFDKSPRQKWTREEGLLLNRWGTFIPMYTNLACIGLIYSVISPLILLFSILCFGALWILNRYNPPKLSNSRFPTGIFYPTAIRQLYTGLYFMELCLTGLFFLVRNSDNKTACEGQGIIMILVMICTAAFQCLNHGLKARWKSLSDGSKNDGVKNSKNWDGKQQKILAENSEHMASQLHYKITQEASIRTAQSIIWIPKDRLGIGVNESCHLRKYHESLVVSNEGAYIVNELLRTVESWAGCFSLHLRSWNDGAPLNTNVLVKALPARQSFTFIPWSRGLQDLSWALIWRRQKLRVHEFYEAKKATSA